MGLKAGAHAGCDSSSLQDSPSRHTLQVFEMWKDNQVRTAAQERVMAEAVHLMSSQRERSTLRDQIIHLDHVILDQDKIMRGYIFQIDRLKKELLFQDESIANLHERLHSLEAQPNTTAAALSSAGLGKTSSTEQIMRAMGGILEQGLRVSMKYFIVVHFSVSFEEMVAASELK
ncbi:CCD68 protein, partial [Polypterus senegalus]